MALTSPIQLVSKTQCTELIQKLEHYGYQSLQVRSAIIVEFSFKSQSLQVWVDTWPEFTTVLLINDFENNQLCSVFSLNEQKLQDLLATQNLIHWKNVMFVAFPPKYESVLQSFVESWIYPRFTFQILALNKEKGHKREIPKEVTVSTLTTDHAELVHKNCSYSSVNNKENEINMIKRLIESYPTVCLFDSDGNPVSYAIGQMYGGIGLLYTEPEYRNRSYGKTVMYLLSEKYSNIGYPPFVFVATENIISNKIHNDLGFEPTSIFVNWYELSLK